MKKPYKYTIVDIKHKVIDETDDLPLCDLDLKTYEPTDKTNEFKLKQTKFVYENEHYQAELRLYNYVTYFRKGLEIPKYRPFKNTEIGKSLPILNF